MCLTCMTTLLQEAFRPQRICGTKRKAGRVHPVSESDAASGPKGWQGPAATILMPGCSAFDGAGAKTAKICALPHKSRLEPHCNLGQKGALLLQLSGRKYWMELWPRG